MNPITTIMQMIRGGGNPQAMLNQMMSNNQITSNPMAKNILDMAQKGDISGIEKFGRNMAKERGVDFDKAFSEFKNQFHM